MIQKLMTIEEAAHVLNVPTSRAYDCWRQWELPMYRVGQQLRCDPAGLHQWINNHRAA
ncbi:MAG: helix-turn-helix domain-containing protein [Streptosporangiales bacterium]|nr:helix-turn-helix domain-containing protein [Streptosporangiales bacterium]